MLSHLVATFESAAKAAEEGLTWTFGEPCRIEVKKSLDKESVRLIERIESKAFRPELRYTRKELTSLSLTKDFLLIVVQRGKTPVAFLHGHKEENDESTFYLDTVATIVEGKGVGSVLVTLALIHSLEAGYDMVTLRTEDLDEKGRALRLFYEKLGFEVIPCDLSEGVAMAIKLDRDRSWPIFEKLLGTKRALYEALEPYPSLYSALQ